MSLVLCTKIWCLAQIRGIITKSRVLADAESVERWGHIDHCETDQESTRAVLNHVESKDKPIIIKKYANRRLYNTDTSTYVTLDDLAEMVRIERDFVVYDAKSGEDLTHAVLTQIIVEQESKGQNLLPVNFLRQLIRFYGNNIEKLVPSYLEFSLESFVREQEKFQKQFAGAFGKNAFDAMQEQTRRNMVMFEKAMAMFNPFAALGEEGAEQKTSSDGDNSKTKNESGAKPATKSKQAKKANTAAKKNGASRTDELDQLKNQLATMQQQIEKLSQES